MAEAGQRRWFESSVSFVQRRELAELTGLLNLGTDHPQFNTAVTVLRKGLTHSSVAVHGRCGDLVVLGVAGGWLTEADGVEMLLSAAAIASTPQPLASAVHALCCLTEAAIRNNPDYSRVGGADAAPTLRHPLLRVFLAVPEAWPVLLQEALASLTNTSAASPGQSALFLSLRHFLLHLLLSGVPGVASGTLARLVQLTHPPTSATLRIDAAAFLAGAIPCLKGPTVAAASLVVDAARAAVAVGGAVVEGEGKGSEQRQEGLALCVGVLHRTMGVLTDPAALAWPSRSIADAVSIIVDALRLIDTSPPAGVLLGLGWCLVAYPPETSGPFLRAAALALTTLAKAKSPDPGSTTAALAHLYWPLCRLVATLEQSGASYAGDIGAPRDVLAQLDVVWGQSFAQPPHGTADAGGRGGTFGVGEGEVVQEGPLYSQLQALADCARCPLALEAALGSLQPDALGAGTTTGTPHTDSNPKGPGSGGGSVLTSVGAVLSFHAAAAAVTATQGNDADCAASAVALLTRCAQGDASDAVGTLGLLCYLVSRPALTAATKHSVLRAIPPLASAAPEAVQPVAQFVLALGSQPSLVGVALTEMAALWKGNDRMFPALQRLLCAPSVDRSRWPAEAQVARAAALRAVCRCSPHRRGVEVVAGLADLLATYQPAGTSNSSTPFNSVAPDSAVIRTTAPRGRDGEGPDCVAMAIEGLDALCAAGAINPLSTWAKVQPFFELSGHPRVVAAICRYARHFRSAAIDDTYTPFSAEDEEFPALRAVAQDFLWKVLPTGPGSGGLQGESHAGCVAAALDALATFHPQAMAPLTVPSVSRNPKATVPGDQFASGDPTTALALLVNDDDAPHGIEHLGQSDEALAAEAQATAEAEVEDETNGAIPRAASTLTARFIKHELGQLGRATRVAWKRGELAASATSSLTTSGGGGKGGSGNGDWKADVAAGLHAAVAGAKSQQKRKASALGILLLPPAHAPTTLAEVVERLRDDLTGSAGWDLTVQARASLHAVWAARLRLYLEATSTLEVATSTLEARDALAGVCSGCYGDKGSTDPVAGANAVLAVGGLAAALPMHGTLLPWLESLHASLLILVGASPAQGHAPAAAAAARPGTQTPADAAALFPPSPHGAAAEVASAAGIALGMVTQALQRFGGAALPGTTAALDGLTTLWERGHPDSPSHFGVGVGLAMVVAAGVGSGLLPPPHAPAVRVAGLFRDAVYPPRPDDAPASSGPHTHKQRGAAVGLGLLSTFLATSGAKTAGGELHATLVGCDLGMSAVMIAQSSGEVAAVTEPAVLHMLAVAERGAPKIPGLGPDDVPMLVAAIKDVRGGPTVTACTAAIAATLATGTNADALCRVLITMGGSPDTATREAGLLGLAAAVGRTHATRESVRKGVEFLAARVADPRVSPAVTAAVSLGLGQAVSGTRTLAPGGGGAPGIVGAHGVTQSGGAEPASADYLGDASVIRRAVAVLGDHRASDGTRVAALRALDAGFGSDPTGSLPPLDWTALLPPPPTHSGKPTALEVEGLRFAVKRHPMSSSLQRHLCRHLDLGIIESLPLKLKTVLVGNVSAMLNLVAPADAMPLFERGLLPPMLPSTSTSTGTNNPQSPAGIQAEYVQALVAGLHTHLDTVVSDGSGGGGGVEESTGEGRVDAVVEVAVRMLDALPLSLPSTHLALALGSLRQRTRGVASVASVASPAASSTTATAADGQVSTGGSKHGEVSAVRTTVLLASVLRTSGQHGLGDGQHMLQALVAGAGGDRGGAAAAAVCWAILGCESLAPTTALALLVDFIGALPEAPTPGARDAAGAVAAAMAVSLWAHPLQRRLIRDRLSLAIEAAGLQGQAGAGLARGGAGGEVSPTRHGGLRWLAALLPGAVAVPMAGSGGTERKMGAERGDLEPLRAVVLRANGIFDVGVHRGLLWVLSSDAELAGRTLPLLWHRID